MLTLPVGVDGGATGPDVVRMRRSIRIANPLVPAAERSCGPAFAITEFATDSPLEGDGFEPLVPQREGMGLFETTLIGLWSLYLRGEATYLARGTWSLHPVCSSGESGELPT